MFINIQELYLVYLYYNSTPPPLPSQVIIPSYAPNFQVFSSRILPFIFSSLPLLLPLPRHPKPKEKHLSIITIPKAYSFLFFPKAIAISFKLLSIKFQEHPKRQKSLYIHIFIIITYVHV